MFYGHVDRSHAVYCANVLLDDLFSDFDIVFHCDILLNEDGIRRYIVQNPLPTCKTQVYCGKV